METRASYLIVGSFVLALVAGIFLFVIWLTAVPSPHKTKIYHIDFRDAVTGLQDAARVLYRGIPVGSVTHIGIDPESVEEIQVTIDIDADTPIKEDTVASLGFQGLTFVAYVQLEGGTQGAPPLEPKPGKKIATIKSRPSPLQRVFNSAPELLDKINGLVDRAAKVLSDENIKTIDESLANLHTVTATFADKSKQIASLIDDSSATMHSLNTLAANLNTQTTQLAGELKPTIAELRKTSESIGTLATDLTAVVEENRRPLKDFSSQGLYELTEFIAQARIAAEAITRLANKLEENPSELLLGGQQQNGVKAR
ncbi:MAG TPA: MlaD family protein [Alphaproteobacteria bacterium]|nr:MlaD family protein [Alphaproteobacteria bacterium]